MHPGKKEAEDSHQPAARGAPADTALSFDMEQDLGMHGGEPRTGDTSREHTKGRCALTGILRRRRQGPSLTELAGGCSEGAGKDIPMAKAGHWGCQLEYCSSWLRLQTQRH